MESFCMESKAMVRRQQKMKFEEQMVFVKVALIMIHLRVGLMIQRKVLT